QLFASFSPEEVSPQETIRSRVSGFRAGKIFLHEQLFILARARGFSCYLRRAARFQSPHVITAVFDSRNFSVDSRNENLPEKRIHQNYVWIAVPVRPFFRRGIGAE